MLKCSPIQFVEQVKVPVLIQLGEVDLRVPPSQGLEYHFALKSLGKESKLVTIPVTALLSHVTRFVIL